MSEADVPVVGDDQVDVGDIATWSVSSSKRGFGVEQLRDGTVTTLWQSEGPQPHAIKIEFARKMPISQISLYTDVHLDDSYTPSKVTISAGSFHHDLQVIRTVDLDQPRGWQHFKLGSGEDEADDPDDPSRDEDERVAVKAHLFQIAILANHLNGKDTHVRAVRIFSPVRSSPRTSRTQKDAFTSDGFQMHRTIR